MLSQVQIMAEGLEKQYYKTSPEAFAELLENLRGHPDTVTVFAWTKQPNFYYPDRGTTSELIKLREAVWNFDRLFEQFSRFGQRQITQSVIIEEILSTNAIEQIHSTRHDIFSVLEQVSGTADDKLQALVNGYQLLMNGPVEIHSHADIRNIYDTVLKHALSNADRPDGTWYRRDQVSVSDGIRNVHAGFYPEEAIIRGMEEFLAVYHHPSLDIYERMILSHIMLELIHPFYDGNGRLGRFLFTAGMYGETKSCAAFLVSSAMAHRRPAYYRALKDASGIRQFGSLNASMIGIARTLREEISEASGQLEVIKKQTAESDYSEGYTGAERTILSVLREGTLLSSYGISNQEIMDACNLSRRTVISAIGRFRKDELLEETKFGKTVFHRLKQPAVQPLTD